MVARARLVGAVGAAALGGLATLVASAGGALAVLVLLGEHENWMGRRERTGMVLVVFTYR